MLKQILKNFIYTLSSIIISIFILNIFYYFNILNDTFMNILMIIISLFCFLFSGKNFSKFDKSRGFLSGLKIGLIYVILFLTITFIFWNNNFKITNLIYYVFIILFSMFGGMLNNYNNENK